MVSTTLGHWPTRIPQTLGNPLLCQQSDECGEQGDHETRAHEIVGGDDSSRWALLDTWNGGDLTGNGGLVESEEDGTEEGRRLLVWIGFEERMDIEDESGADDGK